MSNLALTPVEGLLALVNANTSAPVELSDLNEIFPPVVIEDAEGSDPNTRITLKTNFDFSHAGRVTVDYHRLDLSQFSAYNIGAYVQDNATVDEYLAALSERYEIYFGTTDIQPTEPFDLSGGELSYIVEFTALPESLMYIGTGTFVVNVIWLFEEPELIEARAEALHDFVHDTLPDTLISFMQS